MAEGTPPNGAPCGFLPLGSSPPSAPDGAQTYAAANVVGLLPTWPEVRCDRCRTVYTIPEHKRTGLVSGNCPKCHHVVFSTTIVGDVPPVTFDFNQFEGDLG